MYFLYSILTGVAFLAALPVYYVKMRLRRGEPVRAAERLAFRLPRPRGSRPFLWIHAVSVGEVLSSQHLLGEIRKAHPEWEIGFSTLTNTGFAVAGRKLKEADHVFLIPVDVGWAVRRMFRRLEPDLLVLIESEFWPRLLREAERRSCPVLSINGRISEKTFRRFRKYRLFTRPMLARVSRFLVQTPQDRDRLEAVGIDGGRIEVGGNLKCDVRLPAMAAAEIGRLRDELSLPAGRKVVVAGSVHQGEETLLLDAFRESRKTRDDVLLVLAPRHPEKFADFEKTDAAGMLAIARRTRMTPGRAWDVLLLDTIGELSRFYALSDAAFVGGSLVPWGGQNLLEPAFYAKPVFFGPHMKNFAALAEAFVRGGGARIVRTPAEIADMFLFNDLEALGLMGIRARSVLTSLQGATAKALTAVEALMPEPHD